MNHRTDLTDLTDFARLHDQARRRAEELRRQAITELLGNLGFALDRASGHVARAARRRVQRLSSPHPRWRPAASTPSVES